jgi:hypothetical protein
VLQLLLLLSLLLLSALYLQWNYDKPALGLNPH